MHGDDPDTPPIVQLPGLPEAPGQAALPGQVATPGHAATPGDPVAPGSPEAVAYREPSPIPIVPPLGDGEISWIALGRAKVVKPGTIRARAPVPGALSIPRPRPRRKLRLGQAAAPFPRRVLPAAHPEDSSRDEPLENRPHPASGHPASGHPASGHPSAEQAEQSGRAPITAPPIRAATPDHPVLMSTPHPVRENAFDPADSILPPAAPPEQLPKDRPHPVPKRGLALPILAAATAALVAAGGYLALTDRAPDANPGSPAGTAIEAAPTTAELDRPAGDPFGSVAAAPAGAPTRLRAGAVKIDTPLEALKLGKDGVLQPPKTFAQAGWYADGTAPGDTGPAVIAGHVDSKSGPAVFYRLRDLTPGDRVDVVRGGRTISFTVTAIRWYPKSEFPTEEVYGPTPDRQLRLITCGGVFDRTLRSYRDNLVVYAVAG
ncbi:MAG: class F sortase [Actinomycetota bacterium]|nr:class F sortase [Actinomycetota bacterium]